ncbi:HAD family hydrolase [Chloroflexota bacterium]
MIKAVLFDLDGTIVDSIDAMWQAFQTGVTAFKLEPVPKERVMDFLSRGIMVDEMLGYIYPHLITETGSSLVDEIMAEMRKGYPAQKEQMGLVDGALELLSQLRLRGVKTGVVTSRRSVPERLELELTRFGIARFIDVVVTSAEARRKPEPDTVIECVKLLELLPEECVMVGDAQVDVIAGKAAGVKTVAVTTGAGSRSALAAESPDFIFDNLLSLVDKLDLILDSI